MYLDPERLAVQALALAREESLAEAEFVRDARHGFSMNERRLVLGITGAICAELSKMFADGVGIELEAEGVDEVLRDVERQAEPEPEPWVPLREDEGVGEGQLAGNERDLEELVAADLAGEELARLPWVELQRYAMNRGLDLYDRSGEVPKTKSKATVLRELAERDKET